MTHNASMNCPHCGSDLDRVRRTSAFIWECPQCKGKTATIAALRKEFDQATINTLWNEVRLHATTIGPRTCPSCGAAMSTVTLTLPNSPSGSLTLDACLPCQFVWFDTAEFEALPPRAPDRHPPAPPPPKISTLLSHLPPEKQDRFLQAEFEQTEVQAPASHSLSPVQHAFSLLGFPVALNAPPLRILPLFTWALSLACIATFFYSLFQGDSFVLRYAFLPADPFRSDGITLLTSFFLHANFLHLVGNVYFLILAGNTLENHLGHLHTLLLILLSHGAGLFVHFLGESRATLPCLGASGTISGLLVTYTLLFPNTKLVWYAPSIPILRILLARRRSPPTLSARSLLVLWLLYQAFLAYQQLQGHSSSSALAHLGGALVGILYWFCWTHFREPPTPT